MKTSNRADLIQVKIVWDKPAARYEGVISHCFRYRWNSFFIRTVVARFQRRLR